MTPSTPRGLLRSLRLLTLLALVACPRSKNHTGDSDGTDSGETANSVDTVDSAIRTGCAANAKDAVLDNATCITEAPCAWTGDSSYGYVGYQITAGGDFDADGFTDFAAGAPSSNSNGQVFMVGGDSLIEPDAGWTTVFSGAESAEQFGYDLAQVGDVNGDGFDDLLVGARGNDLLGQNAGAAYLFFGQESGWDTEVSGSDASASFLGENTYARVGTSLAAGGDMDGDGFAELLIAGQLNTYEDDDEDKGTGRVYVVYGGDSAWAQNTSIADADAAFDGPTSYAYAGRSLASGDFDGDGTRDLAVGAPYANSYKGGTYVMSHGDGRFSGSGELDDASVSLSGDSTYDTFGWTIAAGDITGDGVDELIVGSPLADDSYDEGGSVHIYEGAADFFDGDPEVLTTLHGAWDDEQLGTGLDAGPDVNGDGIGDLVVGSIQSYKRLVTKGGRSWLVHGRDASEWPSVFQIEDASAVVYGNSVNDYVGDANVLADLDGDGRAELLVGTGYFEVGDNKDAGAIFVFWSN